ncbi:MAG: hypothetical protein J4F32_00230 [Dehalococcoidia bacterium]|nr:hypothetical protein [Dehalococcoidia bacterium]
MGKYKGNKGNLMQHWTLCEVLLIANCHHSSLNYIDAHAMAPFAATRKGNDPVFDHVRDNLANGQSVYEQAWKELTSDCPGTYPNSANFVQHLWRGDLSMLLCEKDAGIAARLKAWVDDLRQSEKLRCGKVHHGDWRERFCQGLPNPVDAGLPEDALTLVSFHPYMISDRTHRYMEDPGNLYPQDMGAIGQALEDVKGAVVVQMSTYSINGPNPQPDITSLVDKSLRVYGLERVAKTRTGGDMMSLIYARNVDWACGELKSLGDRFTDWLDAQRKAAKRT